MSAKNPGSASEGRASEKMQRLFALRASRFALCLAVVASLVLAPIGGLAAASASPSRGHHSAAHHSGGGGSKGDPRSGGRGDKGRGSDRGGQGDRGRHHKVMSVTVDGSVTSGGSGGNFTLTATSSTVKSLLHTLVTVDVTTSTAYTQPGVSSPTVLSGDFVIVKGTKSATTSGTITAKSVLIPAVQITGDVTSGGAGAGFTLTGHKLDHLWAQGHLCNGQRLQLHRLQGERGEVAKRGRRGQSPGDRQPGRSGHRKRKPCSDHCA